MQPFPWKGVLVPPRLQSLRSQHTSGLQRSLFQMRFQGLCGFCCWAWVYSESALSVQEELNFQWHWCLLHSFCFWFCVVVPRFVISMSCYVVCNCFQFCLYTALKLKTNKNTNNRLWLYVGTLGFCQLLMLWAVSFWPRAVLLQLPGLGGPGAEHVPSPWSLGHRSSETGCDCVLS